MNVFVLCTGRNGSKALIEACRYIDNYTVGHETRCKELLDERVNYPDNHIEADNRLSWFLGRLDQKYGNQAIYVHLKRNEEDTVKSLNKRWVTNGILPAYAKGILKTNQKHENLALDYYRTVNENIELFLKDKDKKMTMHLESITTGFEEFWKLIGAKGDKDAALKSFSVPRNSSNENHSLSARINRFKYTLKTKLGI